MFALETLKCQLRCLCKLYLMLFLYRLNDYHHDLDRTSVEVAEGKGKCLGVYTLKLEDKRHWNELEVGAAEEIMK